MNPAPFNPPAPDPAPAPAPSRTLQAGLARRIVRPALAAFAALAVLSGGGGLRTAAATASAAGVPAAGSPEADLATLQVLEGFEVNLFASEREGAVKPVAVRFDARGRLWVAGTTVYPQLVPGEPARDRIVILEDTDRDGRADRSTVFADDLLIPLGLELGDGGAYVGTATELLHLRDTDGDGRADERRVVLRGFGTGDAHQTINSFVWGPNGELMFSQGLHAHSRVETPWGLTELRQAGLFRLWPRRLRLEAFWNGAMGAHNPYGTVFDRWGQPFVFAGNGHGIYHLTPALIETDHFLLQPSIWSQGRKFGGADVVENRHWPDAFQGEVVSGGYLQNSVERFRFTPEGSTFRAERLPPLIISTNTAFRIVDLRFGPDGALYLCDWCNPVIGHYQTSFRHPDRDRTRGRIWRVTARSRPPATAPDLSTASISGLLQALDSPERWVRLAARRVLADRPSDEVVPRIQRDLMGPDDVPDALLVELLGTLASHEAVMDEPLERLSRSNLPEARAFAARLTGHWAARLPRPLERLARLAADPHPRVRLEAVVACSQVPDGRAVETAAIAADHPMDGALDYAFTQTVHALKPRWATLQAEGRLRFDGLPRRAEAFAKADGTGDTVGEAVARLRRVTEVALDRATLERLGQAVARTGGPADLAVLLPVRTFTIGSEYQADLHAAVLAEVLGRARSERVFPRGDLAASLRPLLDPGSPEVRGQAIRLAGAWQIEALRDPIAALAADPGAPVALRSAAVEALGGFARTDDRRLLGELASGTAGTAVQPTALETLARLDPVAAAPRAAAWMASAPADAGPAATLLVTAFLQRREGPAALAAAFRATPPPPGLARDLLALLSALGRRDPELAAALGAERDPGGFDGPMAPTALKTFLEGVRTQGNPAAGKAIFERPTLGCTQCHAVDGAPGKLGPDLGALGTAQTAEFIVGAILEPQREVKEGFMAVEIETRDGEIHQGTLRGETADTLALHDPLTGQVIAFGKNRIVERRALGSLMPSGLAAGLTAAEFRDLVAYLSRLGRRE